MTITRFVSPFGTYTFPTTTSDQGFNNNFANARNFMTDIPGSDGGLNTFGSGRRPGERPTLQFNVYLVARTRSDMEAKRRAIKQIREWGNGLLYDRVNGVDYWCYCWANAIDTPQQRDQRTDLFQNVQLTFATDDPFWYSTGTMGALLGSTFVLGTSVLGGGTTTVLNGVSNDFTITNNGSAYTLPIINIQAQSGKSAGNPRLQRLVNGAVVDYLNYNGTLAALETAFFNPTTQEYIAKGEFAFRDFSYSTPDGIRLLPGANSLRLLLDDASHGVNLQLAYYERYT